MCSLLNWAHECFPLWWRVWCKPQSQFCPQVRTSVRWCWSQFSWEGREPVGGRLQMTLRSQTLCFVSPAPAFFLCCYRLQTVPKFLAYEVSGQWPLGHQVLWGWRTHALSLDLIIHWPRRPFHQLKQSDHFPEDQKFPNSCSRYSCILTRTSITAEKHMTSGMLVPGHVSVTRQLGKHASNSC